MSQVRNSNRAAFLTEFNNYRHQLHRELLNKDKAETNAELVERLHYLEAALASFQEEKLDQIYSLVRTLGLNEFTTMEENTDILNWYRDLSNYLSHELTEISKRDLGLMEPSEREQLHYRVLVINQLSGELAQWASTQALSLHPPRMEDQFIIMSSGLATYSI